MKKITSIVSIFIGTCVFSQVAIGKSSVTNPSVSLEFGNVVGNANTQRGIILPWVTSTASVAGAVTGTIIFDASDKKVKYYKDTDTSPIWFDLSVDTT